MLQGDLSSGASFVPSQTTPFMGNGGEPGEHPGSSGVYRGGIFKDEAAIAYEDWMRAEQSAQNAFERDLFQFREGNAFNASEAQKNRDWEERMSNTSYQRAMADMKAAGLNPVLAFGASGASSFSSPYASSASSPVRSGHSGSSGRNGMDPAAYLLKILGGLLTVAGSYTAGGKVAAKKLL